MTIKGAGWEVIHWHLVIYIGLLLAIEKDMKFTYGDVTACKIGGKWDV